MRFLLTRKIVIVPMRFKCGWCEAEFDEPDTYREYHGEPDRMPEVWACCPECGSTDFAEIEEGDAGEE